MRDTIHLKRDGLLGSMLVRHDMRDTIPSRLYAGKA